MSTEVAVLHVQGCPSWRTALERVHTAADQVGIPVRVTTRTVATEYDADLLGFTGSPTILIAGRDPFAQPGMVPAVACRLYSTPAGLAGSPTVDQLVHALESMSTSPADGDLVRWTAGRRWAHGDSSGEARSSRHRLQDPTEHR